MYRINYIFYFYVVFGLQDLTVQHKSLQFPLSNAITFQSSPDLTLSTSSFTLSSHRNLGRPNDLFPCKVFSSIVHRSEPSLRHACPTYMRRDVSW